MSKIWSYYNNKLDKAWFDSSNVKYCECVDNDNEFKTLRVVFNNGSKYEYKNVSVQDYLLFREDASQGKAMGKYIKAKKYEYERLDNVDIEAIDKELEFRRNGGIFVDYSDGKSSEPSDGPVQQVCGSVNRIQSSILSVAKKGGY